jgi:hypothetical protein
MYKLIFLVQDSVKVDTTTLGYKVGFTFGSWLPFILLIAVLVLIVSKRYRFKDK